MTIRKSSTPFFWTLFKMVVGVCTDPLLCQPFTHITIRAALCSSGVLSGINNASLHKQSCQPTVLFYCAYFRVYLWFQRHCILFVCLLFLMLCLPDASWGFLKLLDTSRWFIMLPIASYCLLTPPDNLSWLSVQDCHTIKIITSKQTNRLKISTFKKLTLK